MRLGGQGAISGVANFAPREVRRMAVDGEDDQRVVDLVVELLKYPVIPAVKVMIAHLSNEPSWLTVRPPLLSITDEGQRLLASAFDTLFRSKAA